MNNLIDSVKAYGKLKKRKSLGVGDRSKISYLRLMCHFEMYEKTRVGVQRGVHILTHILDLQKITKIIKRILEHGTTTSSSTRTEANILKIKMKCPY